MMATERAEIYQESFNSNFSCSKSESRFEGFEDKYLLISEL